MKTIAILFVTASVVAAGAPFVLAADCWSTPPQDQVKQLDEVLPAGTYLRAATNQLARNGVYNEANGRAGLQIDACIIGNIQYYGPDAKAI